MRGARLLPFLLLMCVSTPACRGPVTSRPTAARSPFVVEQEADARVLIIAETEGPGGAAVAECARSLETLIAHFDESCDIVPAERYAAGDASRYAYTFYLAGKADSRARTVFSSDRAAYGGTVAWVGPGPDSLGEAAMAALGLKLSETDACAGAIEWTIIYGDQRRVERVSVPAVEAQRQDIVLAEARRGGVRRPLLAGKDRLWYAAAGPVLERERFWTACIWADALHDVLGCPHEGKARRLVPVLRDVPVWTTAKQVPQAIRPMLNAGVPVGVLAWTNWGDVPLADRPDAVRGLRTAESMGAVVALEADSGPDAREHFRLAWEVGLHPIAWAGASGEDNPFRLRIAGPDGSPPYCAGGLLPAPINISGAGHIGAEDERRLEMLQVVRDAVALVSFGLWDPWEPFRDFLRAREAAGWVVADLRDLGVRVEDSRRTLVSGAATVQVAGGARLRKVVMGPRWEVTDEEILTSGSSDSTELRVSVPERCVAVLEAVNEKLARSFIKGVTLDPWAYSESGLSAKGLADTLAERYARRGVNTVFFYAYNVDEGAAYRTRHRGASVTDWGRRDLLAHVLEACHKRDIRVVAWLYSGRDRGMWKRHPEWRERTRDGRAHNPLRLHASYFLCPRNPGVKEWYAGLLQDMARRYPTLDGIELCEPVVNWFGDQACYCEVCKKEFAEAYPGEALGGPVWRRFRAEGLTGFLSQCMEAVSQEGIDTYVMTISDAWSNGAILSPRRQADESGFDLEALLDGPHPPDWVNFEIIWQQWAAIYGEEAFNTEWAFETAQRLVRRTDGRAQVLLHVELTDFGPERMTPSKIAATIARVKEAHPNGIECYHSAAIDRKRAWEVLEQAYRGLP